MDRRNRLDITAAIIKGQRQIAITLSNPTMTMSGWRWDGQALTHAAKGTPALRFNAEIAGAINAAIAGVAPATHEKRYAFQLTEEEITRDGWEYSHVENDAHGVYYRDTPGIGKSVVFGKGDLA